MRTIEILGENRFDTFSKVREGCRGIVIQDGNILLSREEKTDWWLIPGGGIEEGESLKQCCEREVLEETGYIVEAGEQFLTLNEYYEEYKYVSHYFICKVVGQGQMKLTDYEKERGLVPKWIPFLEALEVYSKHEVYAPISEPKRGSYQREYVALREYMERRNENRT